MLTSARHLDATANAAHYGAGDAVPHLRPTPTSKTQAVNDYYSLQGLVQPLFDTSFAREPWLIGTHFIERDADRKSDLRKRVISYWAEHPRDSSIAEAVNDALRFIDLIPATATLPYVALADDGEVNFYWRRRESLLIDVGFVGDSVMHYYVWDEAAGVDVAASIPFTGRSLPTDIVKALPPLGAQFGMDAHGRL